MDYTAMLALARSMGYCKFTPLQEKAFSHPAAYDPAQDLFAVGPTSSGKTLIPLLLYAAAYRDALQQGLHRPKMLFIVPYRALAAQKCLEIHTKLKQALGMDISVMQSTGEYRQYDDAIVHGDPDVAVVINEKAFLFAQSESLFLQYYDFVVLDEIGLLADQSRGIRLDFLLAWCSELKQQDAGPRLIALGTPFYDWSSYAEKFHFTLIASEGRPTLLEYPVYVSGTYDIRYVDTGTWPAECGGPENYGIYRPTKSLQLGKQCTRCHISGELCPVDHPCRSDAQQVCPAAAGPCPYPMVVKEKTVPFRYQIIAGLCRWHLQHRHQILVFWNNREEVRQLAAYLFRALSDLLPAAPPLEECKRRVLTACTRIANLESDFHRTENISEDEFFGILDDEHYRALCSGVGFHSSAVPLEVRSYVEQQFLNDGHLRIVCCTETLAYGINSATDAVIVADMIKNTAESANKFLEANEYQNYIGRCGRLRTDRDTEKIVGYVHPILSCFSPASPDFDPGLPAYRSWLQLKEESKTPLPIHSCIFDKGNDFIPFFLLCLIPDETERPRSAEELQNWIDRLPRPDDREIYDLQQALDYLLARELITDVRDDPFTFVLPLQAEQPQYRVVYDKKKLRGFTPGARDYDIILRALKSSFLPDGSLCRAQLIYQLLETDFLKNDLANFNLNRFYGTPQDPQARPSESILCKRVRHYLSGLPVCDAMASLLAQEGLSPKRILVTAIVLCWAESANPRQLHQWFGVAYPLIQALTRDLEYLLQIAAVCTFAIPVREGETDEEYIARQAALPAQLGALERSVALGLQPGLYGKMLDFFRRESLTSEAAASIYNMLLRPQPGTARQLRRIFSSYAVLIDAMKNQKHGRGADNYPLLRSALRELRSLEKRKNEQSLWPRFAGELRNEVLDHDQ